MYVFNNAHAIYIHVTVQFVLRDLVKVARSLLNDAQFSQFGEDPKEEVMTFERMLLQTIKFDLMVEHPYKYMLQYAKALKGKF